MFGRLLSKKQINLDGGLLFIRLGIGFSTLVFHGYGSITGGPETWAWTGSQMGNLGLGFAPTFFGFMAAFAEFVCSILLILGVLFRPAAALLAFTMLVALFYHLNLPADNPFSGWKMGASHPFELMIVYVGLILTGPGRYAFRLLGKKDLAGS